MVGKFKFPVLTVITQKNDIDLYGLHQGIQTFIVNKLTCPPARVEVLKTFDIKLNISNDFSTTETARESRLPSSSPGFAGTVAENKKCMLKIFI